MILVPNVSVVVEVTRWTCIGAKMNGSLLSDICYFRCCRCYVRCLSLSLLLPMNAVLVAIVFFGLDLAS